MTIVVPGGGPRLTRRTMIRHGAAAVSALSLARNARAAIVDFVVVGKDDWLFPIFDQNRSFEAARMRPVITCINQAVGIMQRAGIATVIALTPAKSRIYRDYLPSDFLPNADSEKRYATAADMMGAAGTLVPNLAAVMLDTRKAAPNTAVFFKADTHWTGDGAEACAVAMAGFITAKLKLPPGSKPGTQLGGLVPVRQAANDLADGLPEAQGSRYAPQTFGVHQVLEPSGADALLDDSVADTLLVGNSFMQPRYGFAAMLSNQLGRPVNLAWKVHQMSTYRTLLEQLSGEQYRRTKPKLVVWNFAETDMSALPDQPGVWGSHAIRADAFLAQLSTAVSA